MNELEVQPLSAWDLEMFTIHKLFDEGRDPWDWIVATINKRRVRALVKPMIDGLTVEEGMRLYDSAKALCREIYPGGELGELTSPRFAL